MYSNEFGYFFFFLCCLLVFVDGLYCSLFELVPSEAEEINALSLLLQEVKEKDLVSLFITVLLEIVVISHSFHKKSKVLTNDHGLS